MKKPTNRDGRYVGGRQVEVSIGGGGPEANDGTESKPAGADPEGTARKSFHCLFGVQYNYTVPAILELIMRYQYGSVDSWVTSSIDGVVFFGTIVGMVSIGYMGDLVGRSRSYLWTVILALVASAACTFGTFGGKVPVEIVLVALRMFIGVACGGFFPLSAAESFEESGSIATIQALSVMTLGQLAPYVISAAFALLKHLEHSPTKLSILFHGLLFLGTVPFVLALPYAIRHSEAEVADAGRAPAQGAGLATISDMMKVVAMPMYRWKLVACGFCWFLYDSVGFYIGLYSPYILNKVFINEDFLNNMIQNIYANLTCCFTAFLSVLVLRYRLLNSSMFLVVGNFVMAICFAVMGYVWAAGSSTTVLFIVFLFCRASTWVGVPHCVYLLPNEIFPREIRSTCNGLTAAMGKAGAIFGVFVIPNIGLDMVGCFGLCSALCGLNMVVAAAVLIPTQVTRDALSAERTAQQTTPLLSDPI